MTKLVVGTSLPKRLLSRCSIVDCIGPPFSRMPMIVCKACSRCHLLEKVTKRNIMPLSLILIIEVFDYWGIDFTGLFPKSNNYEYILVTIDYISKWVEAIPTRTNDHKVVLKF